MVLSQILNLDKYFTGICKNHPLGTVNGCDQSFYSTLFSPPLPPPIILSSSRPEARGVDRQRSSQPSRQPGRQQSQQSPRQRCLRRVRAAGRSLRLLRHLGHAEETQQRGQALQDSHHLQEGPQPKDLWVCEKITAVPEGQPLLSAILVLPAHVELHYD